MTPSPEQLAFVEYLRSDKHTFRQKRMKFTTLPTSQRFGALVTVFADSNVYGDQQNCGLLLAEFKPECELSLDEFLSLIASTWNLSVEEVPFYLAHVFGAQNVADAANEMSERFAEGTYERRSLGTIAWWLKQRSQKGG
jgi:hypothetical protein